MGILTDQRKVQAERQRRAALSALVESFRVQELGGESDFLRRGSEPHSSNLFRITNPEAGGIQDAMGLMEGVEHLSPEEVVAFGSQFAQPGTAEFKAFQDSISDIRTTRFLQDNPEIARVLGVDNAFDLRQLMKMRQDIGENREIRNVTKERGEITTIIDEITGATVPVEGAEVKPLGLAGILGEGLVGEIGGQPFSIKAFARTLGGDEAKRFSEIRARQQDARALGELADRYIEILEGSGGKVVKGTAAKLAGSIRSFLNQVGGIAEVNGIPGVNSIDDFLDQVSDGSFSASAVFGAQASPIQLMIAMAFARATNPKARGVSREMIQRAMDATKGVSSGDPEQSAAALAEIVRNVARQANGGAEDFDLEAITAEEIAPRLFKSPFMQIHEPEVDPFGIGVEGGEPKERRKNAFTIDELEEAVRIQQEANQ